MAKNPLASHIRAASPSRRDLFGTLAAPLIGLPVVADADPNKWADIVQAYVAAHRHYDGFIQNILRPAYGRFNDGLVALSPSPFAQSASCRPKQVLAKIHAAERVIIAAGGNRADLVHFRHTDQRHADLRQRLARHLHVRRHRQRLLRQCRILELEDQAISLLSIRDHALNQLIRSPAPDREGALFKIGVAYPHNFRSDDEDGLLAAIFADIDRLWT